MRVAVIGCFCTGVGGTRDNKHELGLGCRVARSRTDAGVNASDDDAQLRGGSEELGPEQVTGEHLNGLRTRRCCAASTRGSLSVHPSTGTSSSSDERVHWVPV